MTNELTKKLICVYIRNGIQIWLEDDRITKLKEILQASRESKFIEISGQFVNTADIVGIFSPESMADLVRHKRGEWKCNHGEWHARQEICECWLHEKPSFAKKMGL